VPLHEDCTGSGCSDDGEFIGGPTAGDVARERARASGTEPRNQLVMVQT
jgi:hypothetical protein